MAWQIPMKPNGVYWIGRDGNVYVKGGKGTNAAGRADGNTDKYWQSRGFSRIDDPVPPKPGADTPANTQQRAQQTAPVGGGGGDGGGGYVAPPKPDKSHSIALNQAGLGQADASLAAANNAVTGTFGNLVGQYDADAASANKQYGDQSTSNQQSYQKNKQTAYVNAAQGRQGLFGTLSSLGALNGSGIDLANRAVQKGANLDLSGAADNFGTNQQTLDTAIGEFREEDTRRRKEAEQARDNALKNNRAENAKAKQGFYVNMSNDYAAMGDAANAKKYADMAGAEYGAIGANSVPSMSMGYKGAAFTPGTLASYMAGTDSTIVTATPTQGGNGVPGLVASPTKKKQQQQLIGV